MYINLYLFRDLWASTERFGWSHWYLTAQNQLTSFYTKFAPLAKSHVLCNIHSWKCIILIIIIQEVTCHTKVFFNEVLQMHHIVTKILSCALLRYCNKQKYLNDKKVFAIYLLRKKISRKWLLGTQFNTSVTMWCTYVT